MYADTTPEITSFYDGFQFDQYRATSDDIASFGAYVSHDGGEWRIDRVLHFHRAQYQQRLACRDAIADRDTHLDHSARHR